MVTDERVVRLFADLARIRADAYARLVAEYGPDEAARMWQEALDRHSARAAGAERRRSTRDAAPASSAPAAGAEAGTLLSPPCDALGMAPVAPSVGRRVA